MHLELLSLYIVTISTIVPVVLVALMISLSYINSEGTASKLMENGYSDIITSSSFCERLLRFILAFTFIVSSLNQPISFKDQRFTPSTDKQFFTWLCCPRSLSQALSFSTVGPIYFQVDAWRTFASKSLDFTWLINLYRFKVIAEFVFHDSFPYLVERQFSKKKHCFENITNVNSLARFFS